MARTSAVDLEKRWYDLFSGWDKDDRAVAMKVLAQLHPRLPARPRHPATCECVDCGAKAPWAGAESLGQGQRPLTAAGKEDVLGSAQIALGEQQ